MMRPINTASCGFTPEKSTLLRFRSPCVAARLCSNFNECVARGERRGGEE